jgi:hypothetical protein
MSSYLLDTTLVFPQFLDVKTPRKIQSFDGELIASFFAPTGWRENACLES